MTEEKHSDQIKKLRRKIEDYLRKTTASKILLVAKVLGITSE
jgi:hypothetical protein